MNSKDAVFFFWHADCSKMSYRLRCYEICQTVVDCKGPVSTHKYIVLT